jgi:hypothetical protein
MLAPYMKNCMLIFTELAEVLKIVLLPLPRDLTRGCCEDPDNAPNKGDYARIGTTTPSGEQSLAVQIAYKRQTETSR